MEKLQPAVEVLRAAILARQWEKAEQLLAEFRAAVEGDWSSAQSDDDIVELQAEVYEILEWARVMTLIGRAQARHKLLRIVRYGAYLRAPSGHRNIEIDA